jgi:hypothetical protein
MSLSKGTAQKIVDAVSQDSESQKRIGSSLATVLPDGWGVTGALRNWGLVLSGQDPTEKEIADIVCTGIADATSAAITSALKGEKPLTEVAGATTVSRRVWGTDHTATLIKMADKSEYVFDWHATLNVFNPLIFKVDDWKMGQGGVQLHEFQGF